VDGERFTVDIGDGGITIDGQPVGSAHVEAIDGTPIHLVRVGRTLHRMACRRGEAPGQYVLWTHGHRFQVEALDERRRAIRDMTGRAVASRGPAALVAPMPGLVVRIDAQVGDVVQAGQPLVVMEAMKMENELRATAAGAVSSIRVTVGQAVERGAVLIELKG
jgi:pyruvate carboxylase subunit B